MPDFHVDFLDSEGNTCREQIVIPDRVEGIPFDERCAGVCFLISLSILKEFSSSNLPLCIAVHTCRKPQDRGSVCRTEEGIFGHTEPVQCSVEG
jgi:hypothetical protein